MSLDRGFNLRVPEPKGLTQPSPGQSEAPPWVVGVF